MARTRLGRQRVGFLPIKQITTHPGLQATEPPQLGHRALAGTFPGGGPAVGPEARHTPEPAVRCVILREPMWTHPSAPIRALTQFVAIAAAASVLSGCDDSTSPRASGLVGTWKAESVTALATDFIAAGMALSATLTDGGGYTLNVANDASGFFCETGTDCIPSGTYTHTDTQITFDPGEATALTFTYSIQGSTMLFSGVIGGATASLTFTRQ